MYSCRICSKELNKDHLYLTLKNCPLTDEFLDFNSDKKEYIKDISIFKCNFYGTIQNPCNFDYSSYYQDYQYSSGGSNFTKRFMLHYKDACVKLFRDLNGREPRFIIEPGSGDCEQLSFFIDDKFQVCGVEPSQSLSDIANARGINTITSLFTYKYAIDNKKTNFDICLSSYTLDHCPDPLDYLKAANHSLNENGILAIEIHDLEKIIKRSEYCLFEHEHTIYLSEKNIELILQITGFELCSANPIPETITRANSLIVLARKISKPYKLEKSQEIIEKHCKKLPFNSNQQTLGETIKNLISRLDTWALSKGNKLVGYGAGGRGVMTLSQMKTGSNFLALLDKNFDNRNLKTPITRVPIIGPSAWKNYENCYVLVFSFGYYEEILNDLISIGFNKKKIISLESFF